jgi:hypothetical protein
MSILLQSRHTLPGLPFGPRLLRLAE